MSEMSKREEAAYWLHRTIDRAVAGILPTGAECARIADSLVDAAKDEVRAELDAGVKARMPQPLVILDGAVYAWCPGIDPKAVNP